MPIEVPVPKGKIKPGICLWENLSYADVDDLLGLQSQDDVKTKLSNILGVTHKQGHLKDEIVLDLYYFLLLFTIEQHFNQEQISSLFSIVKKTHEKAIESPFGNVDETFESFKELLLCHAVKLKAPCAFLKSHSYVFSQEDEKLVKRPPFSISIFSVDQVQKITDYMLNTYFRHFKLYKYAFTPKVVLNLSLEYVGIPESPQPSEATCVDDERSDKEADQSASEGLMNASSPDLTKEEAVEDSPAVKELKVMVSNALNEQVNQLRASMDEQLKESEEYLMKKAAALNGEEGKGLGRAISRTGSRATSKATRKR